MSDQANGALQLEIRDDGVAVITMDVPGQAQNTLKEEFSEEFEQVFASIEENPDVKAAVFTSGKPDTFLAGADVSMLEKVESSAQATALSRGAQERFTRLERSRKPVVAAIHGACLGGGLELALACAERIASESSKTALGLPEVQLGLLPGAGGTQRLPRLIGISDALDMMLTGRKLRPKRARKKGLVDEIVPRTILVEVAAERALALAAGATPRSQKRKPGAQEVLLERNPIGRRVLFQQARKQMRSKTRGLYPAPERIVDAVERGFEEGIEAGFEAEAEFFGELVKTPEARQLMNIFFGMTALKKDNGVDDPDVEPRAVDCVGILGAGLMGAGIGYVTIEKADTDVRIKDRDDEGVLGGLETIDKLLSKRVRRGALTQFEAARARNRVTGTVHYDGFDRCPVIIEAVFEDLDLKHRMLRDIEEIGGDEVIFASNTSSIPISRIAEASKHPETVVGMHYFSPVEKMPLLEIIVTDKTADWVTATCVEFGKKQGKTVIVVNDGVGFYTSRILGPMMNEAARLLLEGVPIPRIDSALKDWGYPVGPITLIDEVGIDVAAKVGPIMVEAYGERLEAPAALEKLLDDDRKGRKNKRGFYRYDGKKRGSGKEVDTSIYELLGVNPTNDLAKNDIAERCALMMVNEAILCLEEGILRSARDGDIGAVFGLGFPPFRGGPFRYVDAEGADVVRRKLEALTEQHGGRFKPASLLVEMAESGRTFYE